jgi:maltose/maltodextrin transport system substrate-binding protein
MIDLYNAGLRAPAHIPAFNQVASDPDVQAFGASAADGDPMPNVPEMAAVWGAVGNAVQEVYNQSSDVVTILNNAQQAVVDALAAG